MIKLFSKRLKNKKGFTLVELVVVIAILGILAAIAVPRLGGARDNAQEHADEATARTILSAVALAEGQFGVDFEEKDLNSFLNEDVKLYTSGQSPSSSEGWGVKLEDQTWTVYKGDDQILP